MQTRCRNDQSEGGVGKTVSNLQTGTDFQPCLHQFYKKKIFPLRSIRCVTSADNYADKFPLHPFLRFSYLLFTMKQRLTIPLYCSFLFLLTVTPSAVAQEKIITERTGGDALFVEAYYVVFSADTAEVVIPYRIRNDYFVFSRPLNTIADVYSAKADAIVEILDSVGNSVARKIEHLELTSTTNIKADLRKNYTQGVVSFNLSEGRYTVLFRVEDNEAKHPSVDIRKQFIIRNTETLIRSSFLPVQPQSSTTTEWTLFNLGGDVLFSQPFGFLFTSPNDTITEVRYTLKRRMDEDDQKIVMDTTVRCTKFPDAIVNIQKKDQHIVASIRENSNHHLYYIPVNGVQLRQGQYEMTIRASNSLLGTVLFATRWLEMPMSLTDLDIATYPLQYLLTEDEYSSLRRGTRESRIQKFDEFWKKKDPTPETAMNEMMAEFYRRVDYAIGAFRTLKEPNGSLTDRGKIYILYGKPTSTERVLSPNSTPKEIWTYGNLNKTFVFEDPSKQGNYKLAESR